MMNPEIPANNLAPLPPKADIETKTTLRKAIAANRELARLKGYCSLLPNPSILLDTVVLKEARASSEIENIVTTQDELYRALASESVEVTPATKEVLRYRSAMWKGYRLLMEKGLLTTRIIQAIQEELEGNSAGIRLLPGTALFNQETGEVVYTPPDNLDTINKLLRNLEHYVNKDDSVDPLIRMAVIHFQFESIHPFYDGNGRTGRILNVLYLIRCGLLDSPILYLSRYIIRNKPQYYRLLQQVRDNADWLSWIAFVLAAVEDTAKSTLAISESIVSLMEQTAEAAKNSLPRTTYSKELVELLFTQPYVRIEHVVKRGIAERRTASKYLKQLEDAGLLSSHKAWKETIYVNDALMALLRTTG